MTPKMIQEQADATVEAFVDYLQGYFDLPGALSQREVARRAGVSYVFLNRIVRNKIGKSGPSLQIAEKIATATGTDLFRILENSKKVALAS